MSNEKDGTALPPPDAIESEDADVTNVKGLPSIGAVEDEDDEDVATSIRPLEEVQTQARAEPPTQRRIDLPPRLPGVRAAVAELPPDEAPPSFAAAPPMAHVEADAEEIETMDDADIETVDDDAVLEEEPVAAPPPAGAPGALDVALAEAQSLQADGGHARLVALYERELQALAQGEGEKGRVALYQHEIGELTESRAGDEGAAVKAYAKALQSDATLKPNLWAIRRVFERRALWPNLQKLLDAEIRFAKTADEKAELYVEKGELLEDRLNDAAGALDCFNRAIEAWPQSLPAWMALEKIHTRSRDLGQLARVWRGMAGATAEPPRKVALLIDLARLQDSIGGSLDDARAILQEALAVGADGERVLGELERVAEKSGNKEELLAVLDERARRLTAALAEMPIERRLGESERLVSLRRRQAALARERGDGEGAWSYLQAAAAAAPGEPLVVRELAELAESLGRWDELADLLAARVEAAPAARKIALRLERAEALRRAGKAAEADAVESEVARDEPGHLGLLIARERAALAARDWEKLAALYAAEAELANSDGTPTGKADPAWAATALVQAAAAYEHLGREAEAYKALDDAKKLVPHFAPAVDALERLYGRSGKHAEYAALAESELAATPPPSSARAERLLDVLVTAREALDDLPAAAAAARRLCELKPDDVRARVRLYELDRAAQKLTDAADDLAALAKLLPEDRRVDALLERADLLEHRVDDPLGAAAAYREALALKPGDARATDAFERLSRRRAKESGPHDKPSPQAWDDLAAALKREAQASLAPERIAAALLKLGEIHERERGAFDDAAEVYRELLERAPGHAAALRGLQRAYAALGDDGKRAEALADEVEALKEPARGEALLRLGELFEDTLGKPDRADDAYGRALELGPNAHAALGRLRTAVRAREPVALAEALARLEPLVSDSDGATARAVLVEERADLAHKAGDAEAALARSDEALALDGSGRLTWLLRARLAAQGGEVNALGDALEALATRAAEPALQAALQRRAGLLALSSGSRATKVAEAAERRLRQAHSLTPSDTTSLVALCALVADPDALGARAKLAEGAAQTEWHVEHAEALEAAGRLGDAAEASLRALELDPRHVAALELLRRLARAGGDDKAYAAATARLAAEVLERERAAGLYREAAETFERASLTREAAGAWRAVLDRTPLDGAAANRARELLGILYSVDKDPSALVELLTHRLDHVRGADDRVRLYLDRAALFADGGDVGSAERDLRAALDLDGDEPEALRRLAEICAARNDGRDEAITLYGRFLEDEDDRQKRRAALQRLAELYEHAGQIDEAVARLEEAAKLAPKPVDARAEHEKLAQLLVRQRQWQHAIEALRRLSDLVDAGKERAAVEIRIATIYREGFSDPRAAVEALMRALRSDPLSMEALSKLMPMHDAGHVLAIELEEKLERAIDAARAQATATPMAEQPYLELTRLWAWRGDDDCRLVSAQAEALVAGRAPPTRESAIEPTKELSSQSWERIWPETARSVALEIWRAAGEAPAALYGPSLESLAVGKRERVNAKGTPVAWIPVDKIARSLCGSHFGYELYASSQKPDLCVATGNALVCGTAFADKLSPALRFRVARKAALLREHLGPLDVLDDEELGLFFAACARVAELPLPPSLASLSPSRVEEKAKQLGRPLARKERKALQAVGARMATLPPPGEWRQAVLEGAARAAIAVGGDLVAAFGELSLSMAKDPLARALTTFAVSDDFRVLRRDMGLKG